MVTTLSVVVPATDQPPTLARCLSAIGAADGPQPEVVVVEEPTSLSAAGARNAGAARASGDVIVFVDADVEVHRDALERIRRAFAADASLTALFGAYDDRPHAPGVVSAFRNLLHHHVHHDGAGPAETFWTGLGAVRRDAFERSGGFDEARYPHPSIEDIELGDRLRAAGGRLVLDPRVQGTHLKRWTLRSMLWTDFARRGVPWVALQLRNRRVSSALNCGWRHRASAGACAAGVLAALLGRPAAAAGAGVGLLALNHRFYGLLARRRGPAEAAAGVVLHGLYHLVAMASVPAGVAVAVLGTGGSPAGASTGSGPAGGHASAGPVAAGTGSRADRRLASAKAVGSGTGSGARSCSPPAGGVGGEATATVGHSRSTPAAAADPQAMAGRALEADVRTSSTPGVEGGTEPVERQVVSAPHPAAPTRSDVVEPSAPAVDDVTEPAAAVEGPGAAA